MAYCNDKARVKRVANLAAELASRFGAHLIGLSVSPPLHHIPAGMPRAPDLIVDDAPRLAYQKDSPDLRHSFLETSRAHGVAASGVSAMPTAPPWPEL
jgi:hypothetical protein